MIHYQHAVRSSVIFYQENIENPMFPKLPLHFKVTLFGLCNASATFESLIDLIVLGLTWKTCRVYLDSIRVIGSSVKNHLQNLKQVVCPTCLHRICNAQLKLNLNKDTLFQKKKWNVGHCLSAAGIRKDRHKKLAHPKD